MRVASLKQEHLADHSPKTKSQECSKVDVGSKNRPRTGWSCFMLQSGEACLMSMFGIKAIVLEIVVLPHFPKCKAEEQMTDTEQCSWKWWPTCLHVNARSCWTQGGLSV